MIWNSKKIKKEDKMIKHYLTVFLISMVPIAELRAAIPYSQAVGLPLIPSYVIAIIGNYRCSAFYQDAGHWQRLCLYQRL